MMVHDENAARVLARHREFGALFAPRSVAVVGASATPGKWGHVLAKGALAGEHRRAVYLVNRRGGKILGRRAHRSLAELPEPPDLVAVAVPARGFADTVDAAIAAGARAIVAISGGLGESGPEGTRLEQEAVARIREAGALLLGPNCLGVADAHAELSLAWAGFREGPVALISQSGNLALEIGELLAAHELGISRFASLGNQADVDATDLLQAVASDEQTRVIALYVEGFRDGRAFARAASRVVAAGKPVVLMSVGRSAAGARSARSHTGALASDGRAIDAACRAAGVLRASTPKELVDAAQALLAPHALRGLRIGVIGDGGGHNAVAADAVSALGFELPAFTRRLSGELAAVLPATASTANPVDFAGGGERDITTYSRVARALLRSGEVDAVLLTGYFGRRIGPAGRRRTGLPGDRSGRTHPRNDARPRRPRDPCRPGPAGARAARGRGGLLERPRAAGLGPDRAGGGAPRPHAGRRRTPGRRAGLSPCAQSARCAAQVGRRRRRCRHRRRRDPSPRARLPPDPARGERVVARADGPGPRRRRAARRDTPGPPLRTDRARRRRRAVRRDPRRCRGRARASRRRRRPRAPPLSPRCCAHDGRARAATGRHRGCGRSDRSPVAARRGQDRRRGHLPLARPTTWW